MFCPLEEGPREESVSVEGMAQVEAGASGVWPRREGGFLDSSHHREGGWPDESPLKWETQGL